jgi:hypothetical protein
VKISLDTVVPLSLLGAISGGVFWFSAMYSDLTHATAEIAAIKINIKQINQSRAEYRKRLWENQRSIDRRLSQIEGKIDFLIEKKKP